MAFNINQRLNGLEPLAYAGVNAIQPPDFVTKPRDPTTTDSKNFYLGTIWLNTATENVWILVSLVGNVATWVMLSGAAGAVIALGTDDGHIVTPLAGVILIEGGANLATTGTVGPNIVTLHLSGITQHSLQVGGASNALTQLGVATNGQLPIGSTGADPVLATLTAGAGITITNGAGSITIAAAGSDAQSFPTDSGTATPSAGVLNIKAGLATLGCGSSVEFTGSSNNVTLNVTDASSNTIIGNNAGNLTLTATNNTMLGKSSGHALTTSSNNTCIGYLSGEALTSGTGSNTFVGSSTGIAVTSGVKNILIGNLAGSNLTGTESNNLLIADNGVAAVSGLIAISVPAEGEFIHNYPGVPASVNGYNTFVGFDAGNFTMNVAAIGNVGIGSNAMGSLTTGTGNTAVGDAVAFRITTGSSNCFYGNASGQNPGGGTGVTTGSNNCFFGNQTGASYHSSESANILIGFSVNGTTGESNVLRIGNGTGSTSASGQINKAFISGIRGITTDAADAIAVLISSTGQLGTVSSSRTKKDNIVDMGSYSDVIRSLRPVVFNYKEHSPESKSVGLIAEEVANVAPQLVVYKDGEPETVKYHDLVPMLLNEFQKHCELIAALQAMNCNLLDRIRMLEEKNVSCH